MYCNILDTVLYQTVLCTKLKLYKQLQIGIYVFRIHVIRISDLICVGEELTIYEHNKPCCIDHRPKCHSTIRLVPKKIYYVRNALMLTFDEWMSTPNVINYTSTSGTLIHKICSAIKLGLVTVRAITQSRHVINDVTGLSDHLILQLTVDDLHAKHKYQEHL